jgi:hypothetical protein
MARECGADLVGIASMDRFEGAPRGLDPRHIFPDAKAMIVMGFRILRGTLRGIEEGTFFIAYPSMGYAGINRIYQPMVLWNFCNRFKSPFRKRKPWVMESGGETAPTSAPAVDSGAGGFRGD